MTRDTKTLREEHGRMALALWRICGIAIDYDGYGNVKGLKGLVDELREIAGNAMPKSLSTRDFMRLMEKEWVRRAHDPKCVWPCANCARLQSGCTDIELRNKMVKGPCKQFEVRR